jgi:nucleotide-binding universal stress UspA family protein
MKAAAEGGGSHGQENIMAKRILVGLDGSTGSEHAFRWATELAAGSDATVQPVMAWDYPTLALLPFPAGLPVPPLDAMQADAEVRAAALTEAVTDEGDAPPADPVVRQGSPGRVICEVAEEADLIVVGSRGLGSVTGVLLGSVGSHCVNAAPCPVVVVPDQDVAASTGTAVVGIDGSEGAEAAVAWADAWLPESTRLLLVHTWELPVTLDSIATALDAQAIEEAAAVMLDKAAASVSRHEVETLIVRGDARSELERLAKGADMLVLGSNGRGAINRFLLGSVASHVVHHLTAPTVIVRPTPGE